MDYYFVPCLLNKAPDENVLNALLGVGIFPEKAASDDHFVVRSPVLSFVFKDNFMPPAVFHRLQATCIRHWPIARKEIDQLLYNGIGVFNFDDNFRFMIRYVDHRIYCRIWGMSKTSKKVKTLPNKARELRCVLKKALKEILGIVPLFQLQSRFESPYEEYVQCSCTNDLGKCLFRKEDFVYKSEMRCEEGPGGEHLITRDDIFGVWFREELEQNDQPE